MSQPLKIQTEQRKAKLQNRSRLKFLKHKKYSEVCDKFVTNIILQVRKKKEEARAKERRQEKEKEKVSLTLTVTHFDEDAVAFYGEKILCFVIKG